ncbi:probable ATP-dependent RNA helicase DDX10 isoform X3 [Oncorhynchus kisutch]|uniref:probable ATP-dependent RNA helicase DDX10 isoform X3 n=1 Tax=Oncorhynchus kisutch TaxID=8019 RepID=UPI0009A0266B|nr:probable ATP-dependent RNA helicase DDX10 isoform X3 [Oncorhynchus kisutch]
MEKGKRPNVSPNKKIRKKNPTDTIDPVKNFERWKKKYNKTKTRVKREKRQKRRPEWQVEKEAIQRLVNKYNEINAKDAETFSDFPISKNTLRGLMEAQYRQPTEIQRQTIGFALQGKDVLGAAKTGSGKTLAFIIPVLECLYRQQWTAMDGLGALIISPTRELAYQTFEVLRKVGKNHEFSAGLIIGGKDLKNESEKIHRTNIIICTPGRLLQHMDETAAFHASDLHMLVLDEADRILDMGFADTINAIVENLPKTRQTLLFSATQTKSVKDLARLSLKDPEYVWVHEKAKFSTPATLEQNYVVCELHQKVNMLFSFIRSHLQKKIIVFFACCKEVQYLFRVFCRLRPGMPILALHGKQQQMKRVEVYNDFIKKKNAVLFATDIAARGLDFPAVNWVLQFDCPEDANTYIHRVGRTARYKEGGEALLVLLPSEEKDMLSQLQVKKVPINRIQVNPEKLTSVQQKLEAFLAQEKEQKERAQRETDSNTIKKTEKETKFKEAKKVLKRNFQVNTKLVFTEDGQMVQQWPPLQRTAVPATEGEDEDCTSGINVEEARERLRREDQEFDKLEYRRKVKEKHREKRLKENAARREASKQYAEEQKSGEEDEEEVVAYLGGSDGEEFDPSTLPDPDKLHYDSEEDDDQISPAAGTRKRIRSDRIDDSGEEEEEEEEEAAAGSRKRPRQQATAKPLDTGLSLAEDEALVLHLLGNRS